LIHSWKIIVGASMGEICSPCSSLAVHSHFLLQRKCTCFSCRYFARAIIWDS